MKDIEKAIGREVRYCRKMVGLTQIQLADELNVKQFTICRIEKGQTKLTAAQAINLNEILGLDLYKLEEGSYG